MTQFYTYTWHRQEDDTPYYVGKGSGKRAYRSKGHTVNRPKDSARIGVQYWGSEAEAFEMEKWWIQFWGRKDLGMGILRNLTDGGDGAGHKQTEDSIRKIKVTLKGHAVSKITRERIRKGKLGKKHSELSKLHMGASHIGTKHPPRSDEWTAKQRASHLGQKRSAETKRRMSEALKGRIGGMLGKKHSEETKEKLRGPRGPQKNPRKRKIDE